MSWIAALCLSSVLPVTSEEDAIQRPWAWPWSTAQELEQRRPLATDAAARLALAEWCAGRGEFRVQAELLAEILAAEPDHAGARAMLGCERDGDGWRHEELARVRETGADLWRAPALASADRKRVLATRDQGIEPSGRSSYFELSTDVAPRQAVFYSKILDEHFRRFKTRFDAYNGEPIQVLLYASRADYLRFYDRYVGQGGEHVLGFYYDDNLVFYDDPYQRDEVKDTAQHECTHLLIDRCYADSDWFPLWLNEGMACYLAAGGPRAEGSYAAGLWARVDGMLRSGKVPRLDELMRTDETAFGIAQYAHAWSWVHYLNTAPHAQRFGRFLDLLGPALAGSTSAAMARARTVDLFEEVFADERTLLEGSWNSYFSNEFALETERQRVDFALFWMRKVGIQEDAASERRRIDESLWALDGVGARGDEELQADRELARILAHLRCLHAEQDLDAWRLGLRSLRDQLRSLPEGFDPALRGRLAGRVALTLVDSLQEGSWSVPRDGRQVIREWAATRQESPAAEFVVLYDDLMEVAADSLAEALRDDPVHRTAVHDWIRLCLELWPAGLERLFPRIQLLVEADPDDENLAGFAAVYLGLGKNRWARKLMHEARERSVLPDQLERYRSYFD